MDGGQGAARRGGAHDTVSDAGFARLAAGDLDAAAALFDAALDRSSRDAAAAAGRAHVALRCGEADAVERFRAARWLLPNDANLALAEAEAEFVSGAADAGKILAALVARNPGWAAGQRQLASIRLEQGRGAEALRSLGAAVAANSSNAELWNAYIGILSQSGDHLAAADAAAAARQAGFDDPTLYLMEAAHAGQGGALDRSMRQLAHVPPGFAGRIDLDIRNAIRIQDLAKAAALLETARGEKPFDGAVWALTELVWRATDDARAEGLSGQAGLVRTLQLDLDADALSELAEHLRSLHHAQAQPLGQSVRAGTQTRGRLFDRRDPEIVSLVSHLQEAVAAHVEALPPLDPAHPLLRLRDHSIVADGGWSVRLGAQGFHSSHIHSDGVLSSACYIAVPPLDAATREGWLELGRPPADLKLDLPPLATIEPKPGQLVLFPSYLYHGTRPFAAGERLSVAFDAIARDR